jgi:hypothetical protein
MARYEHLPIYKQALDVAVYFERVVAGFSRYHKYTLGTELWQKSLKLTMPWRCLSKLIANPHAEGSMLR